MQPGACSSQHSLLVYSSVSGTLVHPKRSTGQPLKDLAFFTCHLDFPEIAGELDQKDTLSFNEGHF